MLLSFFCIAIHGFLVTIKSHKPSSFRHNIDEFGIYDHDNMITDNKYMKISSCVTKRLDLLTWSVIIKSGRVLMISYKIIHLSDSETQFTERYCSEGFI